MTGCKAFGFLWLGFCVSPQVDPSVRWALQKSIAVEVWEGWGYCVWGGVFAWISCVIDFIVCIDSHDFESVVIVGEGRWAGGSGWFLVNTSAVFQFRGDLRDRNTDDREIGRGDRSSFLVDTYMSVLVNRMWVFQFRGLWGGTADERL